MVKKVLVWATIIFLVFFVVSRPDAASDAIRSIGQGMLDLGDGIGSFFRDLVS